MTPRRRLCRRSDRGRSAWEETWPLRNLVRQLRLSEAECLSAGFWKAGSSGNRHDRTSHLRLRGFAGPLFYFRPIAATRTEAARGRFCRHRQERKAHSNDREKRAGGEELAAVRGAHFD